MTKDINHQKIKSFLKNTKIKSIGDEDLGGPCRVSLRKKRQRLTVAGKRLFHHQVSFYNKHKYIPQEISHLCHNHKCFNVNHLLDENGGINKSRNHCKRRIQKLIRIQRSIKKLRSERKIFYGKCKHTPKCFMKVGVH